MHMSTTPISFARVLASKEALLRADNFSLPLATSGIATRLRRNSHLSRFQRDVKRKLNSSDLLDADPQQTDDESTVYSATLSYDQDPHTSTDSDSPSDESPDQEDTKRSDKKRQRIQSAGKPRVYKEGDRSNPNHGKPCVRDPNCTRWSRHPGFCNTGVRKSLASIKANSSKKKRPNNFRHHRARKGKSTSRAGSFSTHKKKRKQIAKASNEAKPLSIPDICSNNVPALTYKRRKTASISSSRSPRSIKSRIATARTIVTGSDSTASVATTRAGSATSEVPGHTPVSMATTKVTTSTSSGLGIRDNAQECPEKRLFANLANRKATHHSCVDRSDQKILLSDDMVGRIYSMRLPRLARFEQLMREAGNAEIHNIVGPEYDTLETVVDPEVPSWTYPQIVHLVQVDEALRS
ncbi:hypothetical protein AAMO2058_001175200 [Amorphochlora amoebiformis]